MKDDMGVDLTQVFSEPGCGKGPHDSAGRLIKLWITNARDKDKEYVPDALAAFKLVHKTQPTKAGLYKQWEEDGDWEKLQKKGRYGHDKYVICYSTCDRVEYDRESKERAYGEKVLFVDRSLSKVATELKEQKEHRCYVGLEGGKLSQQSEYCCCSGCRSTPSFCLHNDVTEHNNPWIVDMAMGTRSTFQVLGEEKITTIKYKKKYKKEPRQIESTSTEDK